MPHLTYRDTHNGFCRAYYRHGKALYCLQCEARDEYALFVCSRDGEPSHRIDSSGYTFDVPTGDTRTDEEITKWLDRETGKLTDHNTLQYSRLIKMLAESLNSENRAHFESMDRDLQVAFVNKAIEDGLIKWEIKAA